MKILMVKHAKLKKVGTAAPPPKSSFKPIIEDIEEVVHPEIIPPGTHAGPDAEAKDEDEEEEEKT